MHCEAIDSPFKLQIITRQGSFSVERERDERNSGVHAIVRMNRTISRFVTSAPDVEECDRNKIVLKFIIEKNQRRMLNFVTWTTLKTFSAIFHLVSSIIYIL